MRQSAVGSRQSESWAEEALPVYCGLPTAYSYLSRR